MPFILLQGGRGPMGAPGADGKEGEAVRLRSHANNYISSVDQTETNYEINTYFFFSGLRWYSRSFWLPWASRRKGLFLVGSMRARLNNSIFKRGTQCVCAYNFNFCTSCWLICIENNTLARGDMKFLFMCSTSYLRSERSERREISYLQATIYYFIYYINALLTGGRVGLVVRALAFHQCGPGSISALGVIRGLSLLVLYSAMRCFPPGTPVFPSHQKPTFDLICRKTVVN